MIYFLAGLYGKPSISVLIQEVMQSVSTNAMVFC